LHISVICPVFDTVPELLHAAVHSVLTQSGADLELILVDDRSRDASTLDALSALQESDSRVRVLRLDRNAGPGVARAAGIAAARGDWIGFIDSDDLWVAEIVPRIARAVGSHPEIAGLCGHHVIWGPDGTEHLPLISRACPGERLD
jgi:glycosyltransferase involved in cell wall biosynthesis